MPNRFADDDGMAANLLYQFPISHFCEKARWALDYKGVPFRIVNLLPGRHVKKTLRMGPKSSVPVLDYGGRFVQDSTHIIDFLEAERRAPPLLPETEAERTAALEWEEYCDEEIGVQLRRFFYHHLLHDRKLVTELLSTQGPWYGGLLIRLVFPTVERLMRKTMKIDDETAAQSERRLTAALERLEATLHGRRFLVGDRFSRADLTAAALLAPLFSPPQHDFPWVPAERQPPALRAGRERWENSVVGDWVLGLYRDYRHGK